MLGRFQIYIFFNLYIEVCIGLDFVTFSSTFLYFAMRYFGLGLNYSYMLK